MRVPTRPLPLLLPVVLACVLRTHRVVPPSLEVQVAMRLVTVEPVLAPSVNATLTDELPRVTDVTAGVPGSTSGLTVEDAALSTLLPNALVAWTVHE